MRNYFWNAAIDRVVSRNQQKLNALRRNVAKVERCSSVMSGKRATGNSDETWRVELRSRDSRDDSCWRDDGKRAWRNFASTLPNPVTRSEEQRGEIASIICSSLAEHLHVTVGSGRLAGIVIHCNTRNRIPLGYNNIPYCPVRMYAYPGALLTAQYRCTRTKRDRSIDETRWFIRLRWAFSCLLLVSTE